MSRAVMEQVLNDICGANLCEVNSMSSRAEARRLLDKATDALRAELAKPETAGQVELPFIIENRSGVMVKDWSAKGGGGCTVATPDEVLMYNAILSAANIKAGEDAALTGKSALDALAAESQRLVMYEDADARLFRNLLATCWEMKFSFNRDGSPKKIRAVFSASNTTSTEFRERLRKDISNFYPAAIAAAQKKGQQ